MSFDRDFDRQRRLMPSVKRALAEHLIVEAPFEEDARHNTDLIVLKMDTIRIACRLRDSKYLARYGDQFTIRKSRPSGAKTELAKVLEGWGDYIFYGFANADWTDLEAWTLGDLGVFRLWHHYQLFRLPPGKLPGIVKTNKDGSSELVAYPIGDLPPEFVKARLRPVGVAA